MSRALLLVDLQNDYLADPGLDPPRGELIRRASELLEGCRAAGVPVLHSRTTVPASGAGRMPHWSRSGRMACVEGTPGHGAPAPLVPRDGEPCFDKTFFSAFSAPGLAPELERLEADELIVCGVHLHGCVRATVLDAYAAGRRVIVAADAVGGYDGLHAAVSRAWLEGRAAEFLPVEAILAGESRAPGRSAAERAARVAGQAAVSWRSLPAGERRSVLRTAADLLESRADAFATSIATDVGKPIHYAHKEVERGAALLRAAAASPAPEELSGREATVRRVPLGVVAQITPWNNPLAIPLGKIAPALALGNAVVWKPSPRATGVAGDVLALMGEAGLPFQALVLLEGGSAAASALCEADGIDGVSITGSSAAGYAAQAICARRRIPIQAELGGNNAAIVWRDADLTAAASEVAEAGFGSAGQRCTANRRVVVDGECFDELLGELAAATAALPLGDPMDPATRVGPLIDAAAAARVEAAIDRARADGAEVVRPGASPEQGDRFVAPALVTGADPASEIVRSETFGPVVVVQRASGFDGALELLNGVEEGLVGALFSNSAELQDRFLAEARAGVLKLNRATADVGVETPFGGWGRSGVGPPEHGPSNVDFYTRPQAVYR